ncbi:MAG: sec-independent protein translocase protein TatC [Thermoproteota archaeon]|nr:sec-independent protein translocase protein TatC [Thermoproteota archaeon]
MTRLDDEEFIEEGKSKAMGFWDHVEELAKSLKIVMITYMASLVLLLTFPANTDFINNLNNYQFLIAAILKRIKDDVLPTRVTLIGLTFTDPIQLYVIASAIVAATITMPVLAFRVYRFINPALYSNERKAVFPFLAAFSALFITGLLFGYYVLDPLMMRAMMPFFSFIDIEPFIDVMSFYTLVLNTTLMMGLFFTTPIFFVILVKFGIIQTKIITKNRKYVYIGLFVLTMWVTPDGSMVSNILLLIPMLMLIEGGILFARRYNNNDAIPKFRLFRNNECKFCGENTLSGTPFCPKCGRSTN